MDEPAARPASPAQLFTTFTLLAMQGFGGVLPVTQRELCERKRWLTHAQFIELLSMAQVLPGPNVVNIALIIGDRYFGWRGAFAALAGMMTMPLLVVLVLAAVYLQYAHLPTVAGALRGMGAVAGGLIFGTAFRLAGALKGTPLGRWLAIALGAVCFITIALLRWPLPWVLLALCTLGTALAWFRMEPRNSADGER